MRMADMGKWALALVLGLGILVTGGCFGGSRNFSPGAEAAERSASPSGGSSSTVGARVGNTAPDFALKALDGTSVRLADLRGKPVLVNFWATWCPPCREEMPALEKVYQKYRDQGFVFLGIDMKEDAETVRKFVQEGGYSWTFLLDPDSQAARSYRVTGVPETFLIDREGIIRDHQIGPVTAPVLEAKLGKIQ